MTADDTFISPSASASRASENPLLDAWKSSIRGGRQDEALEHWRRTQSYLRDLPGAPGRAALVVRYSWAVPSREAIEALVSLGPLLEVGAGTGYWASLVRAAGGDIVATDLEPARSRWHRGGRTWTEVEALDAQSAIRRHARTADGRLRALVLCWPPYGDSMATEAVELFHQLGGAVVAHIGEVNGCTGDATLPYLLGGEGYCSECDWPDPDGPVPHTCRDALYKRVRSVRIPQWEGCYDDLSIFRRLGG